MSKTNTIIADEIVVNLKIIICALAFTIVFGIIFYFWKNPKMEPIKEENVQVNYSPSPLVSDSILRAKKMLNKVKQKNTITINETDPFIKYLRSNEGRNNVYKNPRSMSLSFTSEYDDGFTIPEEDWYQAINSHRTYAFEKDIIVKTKSCLIFSIVILILGRYASKLFYFVFLFVKNNKTKT